VPGARTRFPHFNGFHPKFSAGAFSSSLLADLHNILEILYKISLLYLPILHRRQLSSCIRYCWAFTAPFATIDDARWVKRVDREEPAQKKFVKHRGIREIRVDATWEARENTEGEPLRDTCRIFSIFFLRKKRWYNRENWSLFKIARIYVTFKCKFFYWQINRDKSKPIFF